MHIGFIEDTKLHGGTQLWVFDAINFFHQCELEITVITPDQGWLAKECRNLPFDILLLKYDYHGIISQNINHLNEWIHALSNCDIVICTVHPPRDDFHCSVFAAKCIKQAGLRTILVTKTGTIVPSYKREFYIPDESISSYVISITQFAYRYLSRNYLIPNSKLIQIYQGIDIERFKSTKDSLNDKKEVLQRFSPILGCIGYLEPRKGQEGLIEVVANLKKSGMPEIKLYLVGNGPDEELLRKLVVKLGLQSNVYFIPFTREPEKIYHQIDILLIPSLYKEGLPNVILESFAMSIPVIGSNIGGISEVVQHGITGFLVEPTDLQQLRETIRLMWTDKEKYQMMSINGYKLVQKLHNRKVQLKEFLNFFQQLV